MNDNQAMETVIQWMIGQSTNKKYISILEDILSGIKGKLHIEEALHPRHKSIVMLGINIFPFRMEEYKIIAEEILRGKNEQRLF